MESCSAETLAFGRDGPPPSARRHLPVLGVAAALALGYVAGDRAVAGPGDDRDRLRGEVVLVAGSVREAPTEAGDAAFVVLLHNADPRPVSVVVQAVGPVPVSARESSVVALPGEGQGAAAFTVTPTCAFDPDAPFATVAVRLVHGPGAGRRVVLPLLEPGSLPQYVDALCSDAPPPARDDVVGMWLLEEAYGRAAGAEGVHVLHFEHDGSFAGETRGRAHSGRVAVRGRWWLDGDVLETQVGSGYACPETTTGVWQVKVRAHRQLDLRNLRGTCPYDPGGVWVLRRLTDPDPAVAAWPALASPQR